MNDSVTSVNDLAKLCAHSAEVLEWEELVVRCSPLTTVVAKRIARLWVSDPSPAIIDDIVQEVFLKLCEHDRRILRGFEPRGEDSFFGLLRLVTASVTNDYFRRQYSTKRGGKVLTMPLLDGDSASCFLPPKSLAPVTEHCSGSITVKALRPKRSPASRLPD
jgi:RNA polymerase sigma-70 factor (ECF subfamily)